MVVQEATNATIYSSRIHPSGRALHVEDDPFLDKLVLTFHAEEIRQRVNSAGEIEITVGGN
jgi:hypothetical protein